MDRAGDKLPLFFCEIGKIMNLEQYTINGQSVWRGRIEKMRGIKVEKNNAPKFIIRPLAKEDAHSMSELSAVIYSYLGKGEECFIHKHDSNYYQKIFDNKDVTYIGVFVGQQLIGMSYIYNCDSMQKLNNEIPNSPINFFEKNPDMRAVSLGADSVHPDYRGNNLNQIMIQYRLNLARRQGYSDVFSIIDRKNHWNMPPYFTNGFKMFASAIDPSDGGKIALMHHNLKEKGQYFHGGINVSYDNFSHIDTLLARGFIGTSYNQQSKTINFVKQAPRCEIVKFPSQFNIIKYAKTANGL